MIDPINGKPLILVRCNNCHKLLFKTKTKDHVSTVCPRCKWFVIWLGGQSISFEKKDDCEKYLLTII